MGTTLLGDATLPDGMRAIVFPNAIGVMYS